VHSDKYTITYAAVMTVIVAVLLALAATALKPAQDANIALEKKKNILMSVAYEGTDYDAAYAKYITADVVNLAGESVEGADAFAINPKKEAKKGDGQLLPVFTYRSDNGSEYCIVPVEGKGLWGPIWGYIALEGDFNTIYGAVYDHKSETPGLGAEITKEWFQASFGGKTIKEGDELVSIYVKKGRGNKLDEHSVDGISGATITSVGIRKMLKNYFTKYQSYFDKKINS